MLRYSVLTLAGMSTAVMGSRGCAAGFCLATSNSAQTTSNYAALEVKLKEINKLAGIDALLGWDQMVLLPTGSSTARNDQKSALAGVIFEKKTSPELMSLIAELVGSDLSVLPSDYERAVVRDADILVHLAVSQTKDMTVRLAELEGRGYQIWADARKADDFSQFASVLQEIVDMKKEIVAVTHTHLEAYDANVDMFERGMRTERLNEIFSTLKPDLVPLLQAIAASKTKKSYVIPKPLEGGPLWLIESQKALCAEIAEHIGFDFTKGRLDVSVHPFTGGPHPTDVRITTRYSAENWLQGVAGTVHEVGHALYEQGRNSKYDNLPVSQPLSMGVHESQSLLWERMVFQSRSFWVWATPLVHKHFPHTQSVTSEQFYTYVNQVEPGFIRVEADEVTYPLHILLRFEMEQSLFASSDPNARSAAKKIEIKDLPTVWRERMLESLGVTVPSDALGPLQDVHWSMGALGYFPSYTLGAMMAAQLFETAKVEIPGLEAKIEKGEFLPLRQWLRETVHETGSLYDSPDKLLTEITGKPLDPTVYINYLKAKYNALYELA